jgi:hypothetical protein
MLSVEELIVQYEAYSDEELYIVLVQIDGYSPEAKEALNTVMDKKGGEDALLLRLKQGVALEDEKRRIVKEIYELGKKGVDSSFAKTVIQSNTLTQQELDEMIDETYHQISLDAADRKIKPRTIVGGIGGVVLASLIGGIVCGLLLNWAPDRLPVLVIALLFVGLFLGCGAIIKLCTGQSQKNMIVIGATVVAMILSLGLSRPMFQLVMSLSLIGQ